jgi:DNA mismatch endonuclease (patch repair protein)
MDVHTREVRSKNMSAIRSVDTRPELYVRSRLHEAGFRFRLHRKDLPGKPDIVLPRYHLAILVDGCFWHGHSCANGHSPKSNTGYWAPKIAKNIERDRVNRERLSSLGWSFVTVYECELVSSTEAIVRQLKLRRDVESAATNLLRWHNYIAAAQ